DLTGLGPVEDRVRLARVRAHRELVLHHLGRVLALEVGDLAEDHDLFIAAHLVHAQHHHVLGVARHLAKGGQRRDVSRRRRHRPQGEQHGGKITIHDAPHSPFAPSGATTSISTSFVLALPVQNLSFLELSYSKRRRYLPGRTPSKYHSMPVPSVQPRRN